jgi:hypothetical protein
VYCTVLLPPGGNPVAVNKYTKKYQKNQMSIYYTALNYTAPTCFDSIASSSGSMYKVLKCITNTAFTYICNLAGIDYDLPEDDAIASKHVGAV